MYNIEEVNEKTCLLDIHPLIAMAHRNDTVSVDELWDIFGKARKEAWKDVNADVGEPDWEIAAGKIDIINYICHGVREMNAAPRHTEDVAKLPILQDCESLVHVLKYIIRTADFELLNRLEIMDSRTG